MRPLAVTLLVAFAAPALAADKDEEKAKEVSLAFLKAMKEKDLDAVLKTVEAPFYLGGDKEVLKNGDELKVKLAEVLKELKPENVPDGIGKVFDLPAMRKMLAEAKKEDLTKRDQALLRIAEGLKADTVYVIRVERKGEVQGVVIVRFKDGKAVVVGIQ